MGDMKRRQAIKAELYDYYAKRGNVEFYVDFANAAGGDALAIGCGTGCVLIPTAKAGVHESELIE